MYMQGKIGKSEVFILPICNTRCIGKSDEAENKVPAAPRLLTILNYFIILIITLTKITIEI